MDKEQWFRELHAVYEQSRQHRQPYEWTSRRLGIAITIFPDVFSPAYFADSEWYAEKIGGLATGKSILEVGSGTGLIGVWAHRCGASHIMATDINEAAVQNTRHNFRRYSVAGEVIRGDVYAGIPDRFDVILWNHPFNPEENHDDILLKAGFDYQFHGLERYVSQARHHLSPGGKLLLGSGNHACPDRVEEIARENGYSLQTLVREQVSLSFDHQFLNELRLYQFVEA